MTHTHEFLPGQGTSLIRFGMSTEEVEKSLGPVRKVTHNKKGQLIEYRDDGSRVKYDQGGGVVSISFVEPSQLMLGNVNLLAGSNQVAVLKELDNEPFEDVGFLIFFKIGLAMTGFHDGQKSQEAITLFKIGSWEKGRAKPYKR